MYMESETDWRGNLFCLRDRSKELYKRNLWTDVSFAIIDEAGRKHIIKAHKVILANASEVFEKMFYGSMPEDTSREIPIEDILPETFAAMLKYIYTDEVAVEPWHIAAELFCAAKRYMLYALAEHCAAALKDLLTALNALKTYEFAVFHELKKLIDAALKFIISQTEAVVKSPYFKDIKLSTLQRIVEQDTLNITEIELFNTVESLAKQKGIIEGNRQKPNYISTETQKSAQWTEFREIVKQIRFLSLTDGIFKDGPGFSDLLLPEEAFLISVCLTNSDKIESFYPAAFVSKKRIYFIPRVFFDISKDNSHIGRIVFKLRSDICPKTVKKFRSLCAGEHNSGYKSAQINILPEHCFGAAINFASGERIENDYCDHENFKLKHKKAGIIGLLRNDDVKKSIQNSFIITFQPCPQFNNKNVAFGEVVEGLSVLEKIQSFDGANAVCITNCGEL